MAGAFPGHGGQRHPGRGAWARHGRVSPSSAAAPRTSRCWTASGVAALEPDLAGRFGKGLYFADEGHLDPRAALAGLAGRLAALGVSIRFGSPPGAAARARARAVIDCSGLAAAEALADLRGVKGEMLLLRLQDFSLQRPVRVLHPRLPVYVVPRGAGLFMVGATMLES